MSAIEVFKTDIISSEKANELKQLLSSSDSALKIHFDLDDCDKIMRIKGPTVENTVIIALALKVGVICEVLPD